MSKIQELKKLGNIKKYQKDTFMFYQGDMAQSMYIILSGKVAVFVNSAIDGSFMKIAELAAGDFVGEMSILEDLPRSASIQSLEDSIVLEINKDKFSLFVEKQPAMTMKIMRSLSSRIRKINEQLTAVEVTDDEKEKAVQEIMPEEMRDDLFPAKHGNYQGQAPVEYKKYLYPKTIRCPVCNHEFPESAMRISRLRLKQKMYDFREIHEDFEKLWYMIWLCPFCYYSNYYFDFFTLSKFDITSLKYELEDLRKKFNFEIQKNPRNITTVFISYYLALRCKKIIKKVDFRIAKLWINLAWLYEDLGDENMKKLAYKKSKEYYTNVFFNTRIKIQAEEEQRLFVILGELCLKEGDRKEALNNFQKAVQVIKKGKFTEQARDRIMDVKDEIKKESG